MQRLLEIACFTALAAEIAEAAGASRIELCSDYSLGGVTPGEQTIRQVRQKTKLPLHVIIRPRGGNFIFNSSEIAAMKKSIAFCREEGVDGVVIGVLSKDQKIDLELCEELLRDKGRMNVTFHRAIDECADIETAVKELIGLKVTAILTSGGKASAMEGIEIIRQLQSNYGDKINILPGGGIRSSNLKELLARTGCRQFHSAAILNDQELPDKNEVSRLLEILKIP